MLIGNTHLICGGTEILPAVREELSRLGFDMHGPDAYVRAYKQFGVDEARELIGYAGVRPVASPNRIFVLAMPLMTAEAQNALLKTLEEPPAGAMFFFVLPSPDALLPTLRSRAQTFSFRNSALDSTHSLFSIPEFLRATPPERLTMITSLLSKDKDEKHNMDAIFTFLTSLENTLAAHKATAAPKSIYRARKYMNDKGSLKKVLLEQVALLLPRV